MGSVTIFHITSSVNNSATGITTSQTLDAMGKVVAATDPGGTITYSYYSNGNPKKIIAPDSSKVSMLYDEYGHQTSLTDPDAGTITYGYNAFGELIEQTDARGKKFTMTYDKLGRLLTKTCQDGPETTVITNTYNSSTAINAKGLLSSTTHSNGTSFTYLYDNYSRIIQKTELADQYFNYFYSYDLNGNLKDYTFPSGFKITYTYENGYMKRVENNGNGSSIFVPKDYTVRRQLRWWDNGATDNIHTYNEFDQFGFPSNVMCGINNGTWSIQNLETQFNIQTGNLEKRKDKNFTYNNDTLTENFTYDNVHKNRLASWMRNGLSPDTTNMTYANENGNILTKSDITSLNNPFTYDSGDKPHAVKSIFKPLQTPAEAFQSIEYNVFNKVKKIEHYSQDLLLKIIYGPDEQRIKSEFYTNTLLNKTKYFVGGDYEVEILPDGSERRIHYLPGGGLYVSNEIGIGQMYYVQTDYQGSWSSVTDASGIVLERYSFDPWGNRRNPTDWTFDNVPVTFLFDRGYTGHEMLDAFGLINMNGRVYDPLIARFLSPDNYVQAPDNSQGFNRYTYCLNNPLKYNDPSGDFAILAAVTAGIYNWAANGSEFSWKGLGYFGIGAVAGALGGLAGNAINNATKYGGFIVGSLSGSVGGAVGGFISSAGNAWMGGSNFDNGLSVGANGFITGGLTGGLMGGIARGSSDYQKGYSFWDGTRIDEYVVSPFEIKVSKNRPHTLINSDSKDKILQERVYEEFGVGVGDKNIGDITSRSGRKYDYTDDLRYRKLGTKTVVAGYCQAFSNAPPEIHISPYYAENVDAVKFRAVAGHELIHAIHLYNNPIFYNDLFSERAAYKFTYDTYMTHGYIQEAALTKWTANNLYLDYSGGSCWGSYSKTYDIPWPF